MNSSGIDEQVPFLRELRAWFDASAPVKGAPGDFSSVHIVSARTVEDYQEAELRALKLTRTWQQQLYRAGYAGRSWPEEFGGQGLPVWQDQAVSDLQSGYGVSNKMLAVGLEMLPPVLLQHGDAQQCARYLPPAIRAAEIWCQLLSEPDAGSDLGSARTMATPTAGGWSVTGQKVWTSGAGVSDFALLIARTDPDQAGMAGLSCLIVDMMASGLEVRPLRQMSGAYHFNEVFLRDVFVPEEGLVGRLGDARQVLRTMLASERAAIGGGTSARSADQLAALVRAQGADDEPLTRQMVASAYIRERVLGVTSSRLAASEVISASGSISKLMYSEHARLSADAGAQVLGAAATSAVTEVGDVWRERLLFAPGLRLGGGTDEIQRNAIAERGLGLPR